ncbi:MAG: SH3 domain-containing protein [Caldilineaceae bacterium]
MLPIRTTLAVVVLSILTLVHAEDVYAVEHTVSPALSVLQQNQNRPNQQPTTPITNPINLTETLQLPVLTDSAPVTATQVITDAPSAPEVEPVETPAAQGNSPIVDDPQLDPAYSGVLEGTILANRTPSNVTLFAEGKTYRIAPLRSLGIDLLRETSVVNLYSCDADTPQTQTGCYWDPYLITQNGFYEIFNAAAEGLPIRLKLEEAGAPPQGKIWLQNRTGQREMIVFNGQTIEIPPSSVQELDAQNSDVATIYRRSCISLDEQTVCEWAPQVVQPGVYYVLDAVSQVGGLPNSRLTSVEAEPLVASSEGALLVESTPEIVCQIQVPVVNVRSGPGLDYVIVTKLVNGGEGADTLVVRGRDESGLWLAVSENVAAGGWITSGGDLVRCDGNLSTLPVAEITDGRLEPTPVPAPVVEAPPADAAADESGEAGEEGGAAESTPAPAVEPPPGQSLLVVTNAFEQPVRFTLSPDEYDLQPGETIYVVVNPGRVQFSVSSPWRGGISGNAEFLIDGNQTFPMFLYFVPDPNDSGRWEMKYQ